MNHYFHRKLSASIHKGIRCKMKLEPDKKVKIVVMNSTCDHMKSGDTIYLNGPLIDTEKSAPMCLTALVGIYPWVMTCRFGIMSQTLEWNNGYRLWCPEKAVEFSISFF